MRRFIGISGVGYLVTIGWWCASSLNSAQQKSQTLRCSLTGVAISAGKFWQRYETSVAEAGHAVVFRKGVLEVSIEPSLRFTPIKSTITPTFQSFF